jgi:predicted amino acid-binding ACT domain protein
MAVELSVKSVQLWILHGADRKGMLADALEPLVEAGANLQIVMGYRFPGELDRAAVEVFPIDGPTQEAVARKLGFELSDTPCLRVDGDDRKGLVAEMSRALSEAGISMAFLMAQTVGRKFTAVIGFLTEEDAAKAAKIIPSLRKPAKK